MGHDKEPIEGVKLDDILHEIGAIGKYQWLTIFLVVFPVMFSAFPVGEFVFAAGNIPTRCLISECESENDWEFDSPFTNFSVPTSNGVSSQCTRFVSNDSACVPESFTNEYKDCETFVHERTNSVVYDFGIECNEWARVFIGMASNVGTLLVLPITGYVSDNFGRRVALAINAVNTAAIALVRSASVNYAMYLSLHLVGTTIGAGAYSSAFILATELVGGKWRTLTGTLISSFFATGLVAFGFLAWAIQPWRTLIQISFAPQLLMLAYFWIVPESVRWLLSKGKYEQAKKILTRAAKFNGRSISAASLASLEASARLELAREAEKMSNGEKNKEPLLLLRIIRSPTMLRRMCTIPIWWITTTLVYYGMSINAVSLSGHMYLNFIAVCAIEIPAYFIAFLLLDRIGRKWTIGVSFMICSACSFGFPFIPDDLPWTALTVYLIGKAAISCVFTGVYIYTAELIPTTNRHSLLAFSSMVGRVGSISAPLTPALMDYWHGIPSMIFGSLAFVSGCLILTQPETLGSTLPDTIEQAEGVGT